ncbi:MAG: N-acetyl-gamma-glutamyl-phosphate reductase [Candidatus Limnocylindria bacterium]
MTIAQTARPLTQPREGNRIRVAILGATGYVGAELVRVLSRHPAVTIVALAARNRENLPIGDPYPHLASSELRIEADLPEAAGLDAVFIALPHGQAAGVVPQLIAAGTRVIDMGPDFRLGDPAAYPAWYAFDHPSPELLPGAVEDSPTTAVYGLPELHRDQLRSARLIASPGCYPTATLLALAPLARDGLIGELVVDAKSGVSGAGREAKLESLFGEINESVRAYGLGGHRHLPEMQQELRALGTDAGAVEGMLFVPHLMPMTRGLMATCHVRPTRPVSSDDLAALYRAAYLDEPFVEVAAEAPATKSVTGSNRARVFPSLDARSGRIVAIGVIDNLVKGAAGQAIQSFNLAVGLPETTGLEQLALYP